MTTEALTKELAAMLKDLQELKRGLSIVNTRYNHLNHRVVQLKRRLAAELRKQQASQQQATKPSTTIQDNQPTLNFN